MLTDKYEKLCEEWRIRALSVDFKERFQVLKLPDYNEDNPTISYYGNKYVINMNDYSISDSNHPKKDINPQIKLAIYHLFYFSKANPLNSNEFVPLYELKPAAPYFNAFRKTVLNPYAKIFDGKMDSLKEAGYNLGFTSIPFSDVGFEALAFSCIPIRFLFWDGDDEFPAGSNILFDKNVIDFIHEETVITIAEYGVKLLAKSANLNF